jgi:hypothetical protein
MKWSAGMETGMAITKTANTYETPVHNASLFYA